MAIRIRVTLDVDQIGDGMGLAQLGQNQSNDPGYAAALGPGSVGMAQTLELMISEIVPGGDTPTLANFLTALQAAAQDIAGTPAAGGLPLLSQPGAWGGNPGTPLSYIDLWSTGGA
jgi:hypothetical protein